MAKKFTPSIGLPSNHSKRRRYSKPRLVEHGGVPRRSKSLARTGTAAAGNSAATERS